MQEQLVNLLGRLKQHWTLLIVTHDASDLIEVADYCWRIQQGKIEQVDPTLFKVKRKQKILAEKW